MTYLRIFFFEFFFGGGGGKDLFEIIVVTLINFYLYFFEWANGEE